MLFNSYIFLLLFLPLCWLGFWKLVKADRFSWALSFLTLASFLFYAYWDPPYLILLLASILFNYWIAGVALQRNDKRWIIGAVIANLVALGYYKYSYFFASTADAHLGTNLGVAEIVLPLGISFFTFHQITYLFDTFYRVVPRRNLRDYALYIAFFPQLIAGPVVRARQFLPQIADYAGKRNFGRFMTIGLSLFAMGLAKKVMVADWFAVHANKLFQLEGDALSNITFFDAWAGSLAYTFQLYFDFSGYSDMALGLALLFGFRLPINFYSPYKARNIADFWRRWHMTMSSFFRDYLYIPLGGSRNGAVRQIINLVLTMSLVGLWHGAGWTFILWGFFHGVFLGLHKIYRLIAGARLVVLEKSKLYTAASVLLTFMVVVIGWVLFRSVDMTQASVILKTMSGTNGILLPKEGFSSFVDNEGLIKAAANGERWFSGAKDLFLAIGAAYAACLVLPSSMAFFRLAEKEGPLRISFKPRLSYAVVFGLSLAASMLMLNRVSEFLYFQF